MPDVPCLWFEGVCSGFYRGWAAGVGAGGKVPVLLAGSRPPLELQSVSASAYSALKHRAGGGLGVLWMFLDVTFDREEYL